MKRRNIYFVKGSIEELPYEDSIFDAIFCRQAIMYTDIIKVLKEFKRVLKPNGKLFISASSIGWYVNYIIQSCLKNADIDTGKYGCGMVKRYLDGKKSNVPIEPEWMTKNMKSLSFEIVDIQGEEYMDVHILQLEYLYKITDRYIFKEYLNKWHLYKKEKCESKRKKRKKI